MKICLCSWYSFENNTWGSMMTCLTLMIFKRATFKKTQIWSKAPDIDGKLSVDMSCSCIWFGHLPLEPNIARFRNSRWEAPSASAADAIFCTVGVLRAPQHHIESNSDANTLLLPGFDALRASASTHLFFWRHPPGLGLLSDELAASSFLRLGIEPKWLRCHAINMFIPVHALHFDTLNIFVQLVLYLAWGNTYVYTMRHMTPTLGRLCGCDENVSSMMFT